jgi:hypothetical protein
MPRVALRGSMWLEPGPRNGPHRPFWMFELTLLAGAPLRNRAVDLLLTIHAGFVYQRRARSDCRRSDGSRRLSVSRSVGRCLMP